MGKQVYNGKNLRSIKSSFPTDDQLEWVISTLWIDPVESLVYKTATTTKENGSFEITMEYGAYAHMVCLQRLFLVLTQKIINYPMALHWNLVMKLLCSKEKAPKKNKKGTIEITYTSIHY